MDLLGQVVRLGPMRLAAVGVDVHRPLAGVRAADGERVVGEQQQVVADLGVAQAAAARARAVGDDLAPGGITRVGGARGQRLDDELGHGPITAGAARL